jgi:hypothetical protein
MQMKDCVCTNHGTVSATRHGNLYANKTVFAPVTGLLLGHQKVLPLWPRKEGLQGQLEFAEAVVAKIWCKPFAGAVPSGARVLLWVLA